MVSIITKEFGLFIFIFGLTWAQQSEDICSNELASFMKCVSTGKEAQKWQLNRPYADKASVSQCFSE